MTNLITYADFKGKLSIPNIDTDQTGFANNYIAPFQKEILIKLLGFDLYLAFETGLAESTPAQNWTDLRDGSTYLVDGINKQNPGVKGIITNYVYCKWLSANFEQITGLGVQNANSDNATIISPENKITSAWNDMIKLYYQVYLFMYENETDYPNLETEQLRLLTYGF